MSKMTSNVMKASVLALSLVATFAHAVDDGVTADDGGFMLKGHVYTGTCQVTVNGQDATKGPTVQIPELLLADIPAASNIGDALGTAEEFKIEISGCTNSSVPKSISFNQGVNGVTSGTVSSYKNSALATGASPIAQGVGAAMFKIGSTAPLAFDEDVDLDSIVLSDPSDPDSDFISGSVRLNTQFVKTAASVDSGAFTSMATFDITYK